MLLPLIQSHSLNEVIDLLLSLQNLKDDLIKHNLILDTLEETGKIIIADSNDDPQVVRDVRGELNKIVSPVDIIARKIAERQVKLQNALLRCQEFQVPW